MTLTLRYKFKTYYFDSDSATLAEREHEIVISENHRNKITGAEMVNYYGCLLKCMLFRVEGVNNRVVCSIKDRQVVKELFPKKSLSCFYQEEPVTKATLEKHFQKVISSYCLLPKELGNNCIEIKLVDCIL